MSTPKDEWYVVRAGKAVGPFTMASLQGEARSGTLKPTDQVWREGMPAWVNAGGLQEIFSPSEPARPPTPAIPPPMPPQPVGYATPHTQARDIGQDAGMRMLIPVGRSGWAIASGYLGLFAFFPIIGAVMGLGAVITGIVAIRQINRDSNKHGMGRAVFGIIAGGLLGLANAVGLVVLLMDSRNF